MVITIEHKVYLVNFRVCECVKVQKPRFRSCRKSRILGIFERVIDNDNHLTIKLLIYINPTFQYLKGLYVCEVEL